MHVNEVGLTETLGSAAEAARQLGDSRVEVEHLLLAVASGSSVVGDSLRALGLRPRDFVEDLRMRRPDSGQTSNETEHGHRPLELSRRAQIIVARAEGIAIGMGSQEVGDTQVLLAMLTEARSCLATQALDRIDRAGLLRTLSKAGVSLPNTELPAPERWGPPMPVSADDYLDLLAKLRGAGRRYRTGFKDGQQYVSLALPPGDGEDDVTRRP